MGSDLYLSIECRDPRDAREPKHWAELFTGRSTDLARGIVVDAFGDADPESPVGKKPGYLTPEQVRDRTEHEECPWHLDEPYWVREIPGSEFVAIIRERHWRLLQDGDFHDKQCRPELRAYAAFVDALMDEGLEVRVWCWHSQ